MSLKKLIKDYNDKKKAFVTEASTELKTEILKLAKKVDGLESVRWEQFTPYFNDGESCEFNVYEPSFKFKDNDEDGDNEDGYKDTWSINYNKKTKHPNTKELEEISSLIQDSALSDVLEDMFGDHTQITLDVETGKFESDEYSHD